MNLTNNEIRRMGQLHGLKFVKDHENYVEFEYGDKVATVDNEGNCLFFPKTRCESADITIEKESEIVQAFRKYYRKKNLKLKLWRMMNK